MKHNEIITYKHKKNHSQNTLQKNQKIKNLPWWLILEFSSDSKMVCIIIIA